MSRLSYPWCWCCWGSLHPLRRGWSPAVGGEGGCDQGSSRTALKPGSWLRTPSSSPSPSPRASDSTSCDYRGSGTWGGEAGTDPVRRGSRRWEGGGAEVWRAGGQMAALISTVGGTQRLLMASQSNEAATHLRTSCSITSSQYRPIMVRKSARDTVPSCRRDGERP